MFAKEGGRLHEGLLLEVGKFGIFLKRGAVVGRKKARQCSDTVDVHFNGVKRTRSGGRRRVCKGKRRFA